MATYDVKIAMTVTNKDDNTVSEASQTYEALTLENLLMLQEAVVPTVTPSLLALGKAKLSK